MKAEIGIIGGSGLYSILEGAEEIDANTEFGKPSSPVAIGKIGNTNVAFLARHGKKHMIPPHKVPYKANVQALYDLGVRRIIATNAIGSLLPEYKPGEFVFFDQFVNMTHGRDDTFFHSSPVTHVSSADPYCSQLREVSIKATKEVGGLSLHETGTVVVINGPRFSSKAESKFFRNQGIHVINMTQYPEVMLAREKAMCYLGIGMVTDYDSGVEGREDIKAVTQDDVSKTFASNIENVKKIIFKTVPKIPAKRTCNCSKALDGAVINV